MNRKPATPLQFDPRPFDDFAWAFGVLRTWKRTLNFIWSEWRSPVSLGPVSSLRAWARGFTARSYRFCQLGGGTSEGYVPSFVQIARGHRVNGVYDIVVNNKAIHHLLMKSAGLPCPEHLGLLQRAGIQLPDGRFIGPALDAVRELGAERPGIVVRPVKGMKGYGLLFIRETASGLTANGAPAAPEAIVPLLRGLVPAVVTAKLEQSDYSRELYPRTVNTIRLLTLWDYERGEPFAAAAAQRIGTARSCPADNFRGGMGGLSSEVSIESGVTGPARGLDSRFRVVQTDRHPETGGRLQGLQVPFWERLLEAILAGARIFHVAPMLAWDIALTDDGFSVLELNGTPGLELHQIHRPLLADSRIRNFYRYHRLIR